MARLSVILCVTAWLPTFAAGAVQQPTTDPSIRAAAETQLALDQTIPKLPIRQISRQEEELFHLWFLEYACNNLPGIGQAMHKSRVTFDGMLAMLDNTRVRTTEPGSLIGAHYESCYQLIRDYVHTATVLDLLQGSPTRSLADAGIVVANAGMIALDFVAKNYAAAGLGASLLTAELLQAASWNTDKREVVRLELERLDRRHSSAAQSLAAAIRSSPVVAGNADTEKMNPFVTWAELRARLSMEETAEVGEAAFAEYCQLLSLFPATESTRHWRTALMLDALATANDAAASRSGSSYARGAMDVSIRELSPTVMAIALGVCHAPQADAREAGMIELSRVLAFAGRYSEAIKALDQTQRAGDKWHLSYRLAKLHSLAHNGRASLDKLMAALALGYSDIQSVKDDPDLEWIRTTAAAEFAEITTPVIRASIDHGVLWNDLEIHNASHFELTNVKISGQVTYMAGNTDDLSYTIKRIGKDRDHEWGWAWGNGWNAKVQLSIASDQGDVILLMSK